MNGKKMCGEHVQIFLFNFVATFLFFCTENKNSQSSKKKTLRRPGMESF